MTICNRLETGTNYFCRELGPIKLPEGVETKACQIEIGQWREEFQHRRGLRAAAVAAESE